MKGNSRRVVVTGFGVITANANSSQEFLENCSNGIVGIKDCSLFDTDKLCTNYVGQIRDNELTYRTDSIYQNTRMMQIVDKIIDEMLINSSLTKDDFIQLDDRAVLSISTSIGLHSNLIEYVDNKQSENQLYDWLVYLHEPIIQAMTAKLGINGSCYTNTSACSAGTVAAGTAFSMIKSNMADVAVVVGVDPLMEFSCYGFHSLQNMSSDICKPFDLERAGINIGEGGAAVIFEDYEHALQRNAKIYCEVLGYGIGNDAYHVTSPDPTGEGAYNVMNMALKQAGITPAQIDYVNAHGTGTELNDSMEVKAIDKMFGSERTKIYVSSTKSMIGHCLAAAGVVELVATILCVSGDLVLPTANLENQITTDMNIDFVRNKCKNVTVNYAISNSFAFAGNSASIVLGKI